MKKEIGALILLLPCAVTDLKYRKIPVVFVSVFAAVAACIGFKEASLNLSGLICGMIPGFFMIAVSLMTRGKAGMGDGFMVTALGIWYGFATATGILMTALFMAAVYGVFRILLKKGDRESELPFAPFLLLACVIARAVYYLQGGAG